MEIGFGIDFGCSAIKSGIIDSSGNIIYSNVHQIKRDNSSETVFDTIKKSIDAGLDFIKERGYAISRIGLGQPFFPIGEDGILTVTTNIPEMDGFPLKKSYAKVMIMVLILIWIQTLRRYANIILVRVRIVKDSFIWE